MNNSVKKIIKQIIYIIGMSILLLLLLFIIVINSYFYPRYLDIVENKKMRFMDCEYWKNNQIPNNLKGSQNWKMVTTIGECYLINKKYFLEQNIKNKTAFRYYYEYKALNYNLRHSEELIEDQVSYYIRELKGK